MSKKPSPFDVLQLIDASVEWANSLRVEQGEPTVSQHAGYTLMLTPLIDANEDEYLLGTVSRGLPVPPEVQELPYRVLDENNRLIIGGDTNSRGQFVIPRIVDHTLRIEFDVRGATWFKDVPQPTANFKDPTVVTVAKLDGNAPQRRLPKRSRILVGATFSRDTDGGEGIAISADGKSVLARISAGQSPYHAVLVVCELPSSTPSVRIVMTDPVVRTDANSYQEGMLPITLLDPLNPRDIALMDRLQAIPITQDVLQSPSKFIEGKAGLVSDNDMQQALRAEIERLLDHRDIRESPDRVAHLEEMDQVLK